jgi:trimethylamine--corrinoid protein Co-methyltransferase
MRVNYQVNVTPQFRILSDGQIEEIVSGALEVLRRTGTRVHQQEALELLQENGAQVGDGDLVRMPATMVQDAIAKAPARIIVAGRDRSRKIALQKDHIYFGTGSDTPFIRDPYDNKRRRFTFEDNYNAAKIADSLSNIDFYMPLGLTSDVPIGTYDRHQFLATLRGVTKPLVVTAVDREGLADQYRMACEVVGGEAEFQKTPLFVIYTEPSSPLEHSKEATEKVLFAAEKNIPAIITPCPSAGGTAPATMAGVLVQALAECLSGIVIAQLKDAGAPVIMGGVVTIIDMLTTIYSYGAPELVLLSAGFTEISKWLRLPMFSTAGCTDAKTVDQQAAIEGAISIAIAALSGASLIHDVGYMESGLVGSYDMLVMSNEIIGMVKRIMGGIAVDEETLALDVIADVGPGGHFLAEEHTLKHFREFWLPELIDRSKVDDWEAAGAKTLGDRVHEKVINLIETYDPEPIPEDVDNRLREIIDQADERHKEEEKVALG